VYNSRNYENFSEDGILSGKLAAAMVKGAKENNLYCYVKHLALSEPGQNPKNLNTWITESNLRENYLKAFEVVVKAGDSNAIMSSFNCVGAVLSGYNHALLTDILRTEWGFEGSVITDWFEGSGYADDYTAGVLAGNDLWLAGTGTKNATLDLSDPAVAYAARLSAKNIIYTYIDTLSSSETVGVVAAAESPVITIVWVAVDVVLGAGFIVCAVFITLTYINPRKKKTEGGVTVSDSEDKNAAGT